MVVNLCRLVGCTIFHGLVTAFWPRTGIRGFRGKWSETMVWGGGLDCA